MFTLDIPGVGTLQAEHLVLDFNGTLAEDGQPIRGIKTRLATLAKAMQIHVISDETFGDPTPHFNKGICTVHHLKDGDQAEQKSALVRELGGDTVIAIGNGMNDSGMLAEAALGMAVLQQEGLAVAAVGNAEVLFTDILAALEALLNPMRLVASLRLS